MTLLELAIACEQAVGSDRELNIEIALAVTPNAKRRKSKFILETYDMDIGGGWFRAPFYTVSIDAAMTLVPKGLILRQYIATRYVPHQCEVAVDWAHGGWVGHSDHSFALALCAAALRARAIGEPAPSVDGATK